MNEICGYCVLINVGFVFTVEETARRNVDPLQNHQKAQTLAVLSTVIIKTSALRMAIRGN